MSIAEQRPSRTALCLIPASILLVGCAASLLPPDMLARTLNVLAAWLAVSLPAGVVIGHCVPD